MENQKAELNSKLEAKNLALGNLHGTQEAKKMSLLELMAKVHEEDAEAVLAAKAYIRKPNEANLMHLLYELIDGQMIRESIICKYIPEKLTRDEKRADVYKANCNCYNYADDDCQDDYENDHKYSTFGEDDVDNEVDFEPDIAMYEVCHLWRGKMMTDEVFDTKDEALESISEYYSIDRKEGIKNTYFIRKFAFEKNELVVMED